MWIAITLLLGAGFGIAYALTGYGKNNLKGVDSEFSWSKAKYPVAIFAGAGLLAGVFGEPYTAGALETFATFLAFIADQLREMYFAGSQSYESGRNAGMSQGDALAAAFREAAAVGDISGMVAAMRALTDEHGQPSLEELQQRSDSVRGSYESGGASGVYQDHIEVERTEGPVPEPSGGDSGDPASIDLNEESDYAGTGASADVNSEPDVITDGP